MKTVCEDKKINIMYFNVRYLLNYKIDIKVMK